MQVAYAAVHKKDSGKNLIGLYVRHEHHINWIYTVNYLINFIVIHITVSE